MRGIAGAAALTGVAQAQDKIYVPLFTYRTGPFADSGIPIANGMHDYLTMLNERDGGIGGVKLDIEECETGYNTKKGVECYEAIKGKHPTVVNPYSTGITLQLIPKAAVDKIPVLSMAYGLSASAIGKDFPWIFNPPATYWDGMSMIIRYIGGKEGGLDKLKGKKIGFIYLDAGYGREPIPLLQQLAKDYGFEVKLYPVAGKEMQDQSSQWLTVRRDRPNWMIMWGWGAMNPTAVKRAAENGYPMDHFIGVWWSGSDDDARGGGMPAKGYLALNFSGLGADYPAHPGHQEIRRGQGQEPGREGQVRRQLLQPRRLQPAAGGRSHPQRAEDDRQEGRSTGADMRRGLETLNITAGALEGARPPGLRHAGARDLRRPQRPRPGLHAAVGRQDVAPGLRLDRAHEGQGDAAARSGGRRLRQEEHRLAEAHRGLRQVVVELTKQALAAEEAPRGASRAG